MNKTEFELKLSEIKSECETQKAKEREFNIFKALYDEKEEKLHSRFISYLLSPASRHGMGEKFVREFVDVVSNSHSNIKFDTLGCEVVPNEEDKSEYKFIDILIRSQDRKSAIIIENKIYASDSVLTKDGEEHQLDTYYNQIKSESYEEIFVLYLTLDRHEPQRQDLLVGKDVEGKIRSIDYRTEIKEWLNSLIPMCEKENGTELLKEVIAQYLITIDSLVNDVERAQRLQELIGDNIDEALEQKDIVLGMADFVHVKWHTVVDFWSELTDSLKDELTIEMTKQIELQDITDVTHKERGTSHGINFRANGIEWYVVNDRKNGLTFGKVLCDSRKEDVNWFRFCSEIKFADFDNEATFRLINKEIREATIYKLTKEISEKLKLQ